MMLLTRINKHPTGSPRHKTIMEHYGHMLWWPLSEMSLLNDLPPYSLWYSCSWICRLLSGARDTSAVGEVLGGLAQAYLLWAPQGLPIPRPPCSTSHRLGSPQPLSLLTLVTRSLQTYWNPASLGLIPTPPHSFPPPPPKPSAALERMVSLSGRVALLNYAT